MTDSAKFTDETGPFLPTRDAAKFAGSNKYMTFVPCVNGHVATRNTSEGKCNQCRHESWARTRVRLGQAPFKPNLEKRAAAQAGENTFVGKPCPNGHPGLRWTHNSACVECTVAAARAFHRTEDGKAYLAQWRSENPETVRLYMRSIKAKRRGAEGKYTPSDVRRIMVEQDEKCAICNDNVSEKSHVDHIIPLARGGTNWPDNIQILCPPCNMSKGAKTMEEFTVFRELRAANDNSKPPETKRSAA